MKSNLRWDLRKHDDVVEVSLEGDLDSTNALDLLNALRFHLRNSINRLVLSAENLEYISSEGFKAIFHASEEAKVDSTIVLRDDDDFISDIIKETGLEDLFIIKKRSN